MKNHFIILDEIIYKGLRPWLEANNPDEKFASMISSVKEIEPTFQPKYQVNFERPFNNKTKYYSKFILAEKLKAINGLLDALHEDENPQLIKYRLNDTLNKKLKTKIKDIGKIIKDQQFEPSYIDPKKTTFDVDQDHKTNTYVFQLLKVSLIHMYLEIQEVFKSWVKDDFVIEDFYTQLLFEPITEKTYIEEAPETINIAPQPITIKPQETQKVVFVPILDDVRPSKKGVATFHDLVKNSRRFGAFEEKLFQNDFINEQYSYCGKQGYKNQLAIIYHLIIEKNYFNSFNDSEKKKVTAREIVKFLNHRYDVDIDKQFRSYKNKPEERASFIESQYWLSQIPMC